MIAKFRGRARSLLPAIERDEDGTMLAFVGEIEGPIAERFVDLLVLRASAIARLVLEEGVSARRVFIPRVLRPRNIGLVVSSQVGRGSRTLLAACEVALALA
jgi:hypothetical protein